MFNPTFGLTPGRFLDLPGLERDDIQRQISTFLIARAIREAFPEEVANVYNCVTFVKMPEVEVLRHMQSKHATLGPIKFNEGTIDGQYGVLNTIFCDQFGLHKNPSRGVDEGRENSEDTDQNIDWAERLYLVYGDQKTVQLIRTVQEERIGSEQPYDTYGWVLPVPALFHLQMNLQWGIQRVFEGTQATNDKSTLHHAKNILERKHIPSVNGPFHHTQELIEHSFAARVVAMLFTNLQQDNIDTLDSGEVARYISGLTSQQFLQRVEQIRQQCLDSETAEYANDDEFYNHVKFMELAEMSMSLRLAIKHADIGLLRRIVHQCCLVFLGTKQPHYASEMMRLTWLISTEACDPQLQQAILSNGLVNNQGRSDSWFPVDRMNEHLNLSLKEILWARKNSTFNVDYLFDNCTWTATHSSQLKDSIEREFGEKTNSEHTTRSRHMDIRCLAHNLTESSIVYHPNGRDSSFIAADVLQAGQDGLAKAIKRFNEVFKSRPDESVIEPENVVDGQGDMPSEEEERVRP